MKRNFHNNSEFIHVINQRIQKSPEFDNQRTQKWSVFGVWKTGKFKNSFFTLPFSFQKLRPSFSIALGKVLNISAMFCFRAESIEGKILQRYLKTFRRAIEKIRVIL